MTSQIEVISELRGVTCHGIHSVTCHPTQVNSLCLTPATDSLHEATTNHIANNLITASKYNHSRLDYSEEKIRLIYLPSNSISDAYLLWCRQSATYLPQPLGSYIAVQTSGDCNSLHIQYAIEHVIKISPAVPVQLKWIMDKNVTDVASAMSYITY